MRRIIVSILFLMISTFNFAALNDSLGLLKDDEKIEINDKIEEIKKEKDLTVFVNTLAIDEGFAVSDPERALIVNLKKGDKENYKIEVSFSKDIDVDDYEKDINDTLNDSQVLLERKEYKKYILTVLDGMSSVLQEVNIEPLNQMTMTKEQEGQNMTVINAMFFILVAVVGYRMYQVIYKDRNKNDDGSIL